MIATVLSVNAGRPAPVAGLRRPSGIRKEPVGRIEVRDPGPKRGGLGSGVVGDHIISRKHHGGETQAVYAVAREELDWWGRELGRELPDGMFGENLTTSGIDVDHAEVGEQWRVGTALLEVCGPRVPCATFALHMGERRWVRRFAERGLTGAYLAVREAGVVEVDDPVEVVHRPGHGLTVPVLFRAVMGERELARVFLEAGILPEAEHEWLASGV
ncbi:MOSC domain-containing protein YiiM [Nocardioides cavernae]|uniref:MOSC domain-containing protein YiiM n=1 Tax=Nocardioides cavernae TaxID=1921566 RepID=A0A7Y9KT97_9ACTN|nr:MOSC domain-containing protein [Nocardioides cavernae]NYE37377.1 MOSC domain-containing protein YiiM [Nocardioides cavernae]